MARVQVLLAAVLFGTTGTAQALGPGAASPLSLGAGRIVLGGALLALVAVAAGARSVPRPLGLVALAGAGVALYQLAFFAALELTGVAVGTVVAIGSGPVVAGGLERLVEGVRPGRRWAAATALACAGVALLALAGAPGAAASPAGVALALGAGAGYAAYAVVAKRLLRAGHAPAGVMGAAFGGGALLLLPVLALTDTAWLATGEGAVVVLYLGVVPTALAYVLFARGLRRLSAAETTTLVLAEPVTAALLGTLALGERLGPGAALGGGLVLAGLVALAAPARPARARAPRPEAAG